MVEIIDERSLEKTSDKPMEVKFVPDKLELQEMSDEEFTNLVKQMDDPLQAQKILAAKICHYLGQQIDMDLHNKKILSDHTRRWVELYNNMVEKIHKEQFGEKSVNLHVHTISHSDIASKIREANKNADS